MNQAPPDGQDGAPNGRRPGAFARRMWGGIALVGVPPVAYALAAIHFDTVDWGTAGEWAAAVLTAPVLVIAIIALTSERRQTERALKAAEDANKQARDQWKAEIDQRERTQASLVGCFYRRYGEGWVDILCRNDSGALIYDVRPCAISGGRDHRGPATVLLADGRPLPDWPMGGVRLAPGEDQTFRLRLPGPARAIFHDVLVPNAYGVTFADNAGRWWRKWGDISLEVDPEAHRPGSDHTPSTPRARRLAGLG